MSAPGHHCLDALTGAPSQRIHPGCDGFVARSKDRQQRLKATIWNLRRLLREAMGEGASEELANVLNFLVAQRDRIERAFIAWIDLIDVLVRHEEQRYGSKPGRGPQKAAELKAVMRYLLRAERLDIPRVPEILEPVVLDIVVDYTVDWVVLVLNQYGMWGQSAPIPAPRGTFWRTLWRWLCRVTAPLWHLLVRLFRRLWDAFRRPAQLRPEVAAAVEKLEREGLMEDPGELIRAAVGALEWVGEHREQLVAAFELVFAAVQEAENYLELSGSEKKAYARDLVFAVLDEIGFAERTGLAFAVLISLVDTSIEGAVHLFNKHNVFTHRSSL